MANRELITFQPGSPNIGKGIPAGDVGYAAGKIHADEGFSFGSGAGQTVDSYVDDKIAAARVGAMLKSRGITDIRAIAFKSAEGWELTGNQSYKTETRPTGRFLGDYANATAAWDANYQGVPTVAGDYYWNTSGTIGLFECTTSNASAQRHRGSSAHMPLEAVFVATGTGTGSRLLIFDLTDPLMPLWMEFVGSANTALACSSAPDYTGIVLGAFDRGVLSFGTNGGGGSGISLRKIDFIRDVSYHVNASSEFRFASGLKDRNSALGYKTIGSQFVSISGINRVSTKDGYTVAALSGGVSVIKPDGTVLRSSSTNAFKAVAILNGRLYAINDTANPEQLIDFGPVELLGASFTAVNTWTSTTVPSFSSSTLTGLGNANNSLIVPSASSVDQLWPNPAVLADSLIARRGTTFATPPMKKPELMLICSTVEGSRGSSPVIPNGAGEFTAADGTSVYTQWAAEWSNLYTSTFTVQGNKGRFAPNGGFPGARLRIPNLEVNKTYVITMKIAATSSSATFVFSRNTGGGAEAVAGTVGIINETIGTTEVTRSLTFRASATTCDFSMVPQTNSVTFEVDDITIQEVIADHSGKSNHATINGTLTATAEVAGGVAGLSGFTVNTNYLEAPNPLASSSADPWWVGFAFKTAASSVIERFITITTNVGSSETGAVVLAQLTSGGNFEIGINADVEALSSILATSASAYDDGLLHTAIIRYDGTNFTASVDGQQFASVAKGAHGTFAWDATERLFIGRNNAGTSIAPNSTIWFAGGGKVALTDEEVSLMHTHMRNLIMGKAALDEIPSALAYDPIRKAVEMVGATKRQTMQAGAITASVNHGQGTTPAVAVGPRSEIGIGGTTGVSISVPERNLREYQARRTTESFTVKYAGNATASRVLFPDPATAVEMAVTLDAKPVRVSNAGVVQTEGASDDYTVKDYGLGRYVVQFAVAPADGNDVLIEFEREVWK